MKRIQFDYFHGTESEQYTFYRVPKMLFTDDYFKCISCEAKVLYGLMLDRMSLSMKNQWFDEHNRVYIIFTVEEVMNLIGCGSQKAVKLMKELDTENGIGLIEKKRLGMGKANVIYVRNFFMKSICDESAHDQKVQDCNIKQNCENQNSIVLDGKGEMKDDFEKVKTGDVSEQIGGDSVDKISAFDLQNCENQNSGVVKIKIQEFPKSQFMNSENQNSITSKIENQEFRKSKGNNTDINNTDNNDTESIFSYPASEIKKKNMIDEMEVYRKIIRNNISYSYLVQDGYYQVKDVDELVNLIVDVMMLPEKSMIRIAGMERPVAIVKSQFMKLNMEHIQYVISCLQKNTKKIGNIKSYMLTALYNAPMTMEHYYQAQVNYDVHGGY